MPQGQFSSKHEMGSLGRLQLNLACHLALQIHHERKYILMAMMQQLIGFGSWLKLMYAQMMLAFIN